jgi:predicted metalloendopeptidase
MADKRARMAVRSIARMWIFFVEIPVMRSGILIFGLLACALIAPADAAGMRPRTGEWGIDLWAVDTSVKPGDDFFLYVNGNWLKTAKILPDRSSAGVTTDLVRQSESRLLDLAATMVLLPDSSLTPEQRKLRDLYKAYTDQKQIDAQGLKPVADDLAKIWGLRTKGDIAAAMGDPALMLDGPFALAIAVDSKNPDAYAVNLTQSGLGLPGRDYYLRNDMQFLAIRASYKLYLATILNLAGIADADSQVEPIINLEKKLAAAQWSAADRSDAAKTYNPMTVSALVKYAPQFPWRAMLSSAGVPLKSPKSERIVIVAEKSAFPKLAKIFADTPVAVWRDYLTARYLHAMAAYLPKKFEDADFAFYGRTLQHKTQQLDRDRRGVQLLNDEMGDALAKIYITKFFPPDTKARAEALAANLLTAYAADIKTLSWMTPATRGKALDKLSHFTTKIGYPDTWRDYSALDISADNLVRDIESCSVFEWSRQLKRLDAPVDRSEWAITAPTANAYYDPTMNEVVFPAGILEPPLFDPNADDAVNYGGIGAVIGHEISHGFDDEGSNYDGQGRLRNWWTDEDRKNFDARASALAKQYDQYEPLPGIHIDGRRTLAENLGDLAGLEIAYKAYHIALGGKEAPVIDGYTGDQRFYLSYGQSLRTVYRNDTLRQILQSNFHSPSQYRVDGIVRNADPWYAAFGVKQGDKYYLPPEQRVTLW